ncbi:futalosine hydrolase [Fictibacillus terranigra]|uniref:Futalosine hydrolase n=1 Tax=Fictibacillus terranigra TaxID=3058424 RepID=A0ABT8E843_9BACL|nr:futalosine hydrolase [Fictibacillus sp. CENA-BCM004]MDN4074060.1 futalosine hydrolase [Fictibacillus sp. CENA-BCM004]
MKNGRILIMTSVQAEKEAVLRGLKDDRVDVVLAGVGPVAAAINTMKALTANTYELVINAGIAGGFSGRADIGSLVIASEIVCADLGAESPEGFLSMDELGIGSSTRIEVDEGLVHAISSALSRDGQDVQRAPILTLSKVTGTEETTVELMVREPEAAAEAMEGYGVACAAQEYNLPVLEIRAISNAVGPRDREAWRIKDALQSLESASKVFMEVL